MSTIPLAINSSGYTNCGCGLSVQSGSPCPPPINCGTDSTGSAPPTASQMATYNAITCPSGYTKASGGYLEGWSTEYVPIAADLCLTGPTGIALGQMSDPGVAALNASQTTQQYEGYAMVAAGAGLILLGDGAIMKLAGAALAVVGLIRGSFIGGL